MKIKILTDSCCDLPIEIINEYNIDVLPIVVLKDEKEYFDQINITPKEVYDGMRKGEIFKTAQISPISFQEKFEEYARDKVSVIYVAFSSALSGTYQTSLFVKESIKEEYPDFDIDIVDTKAASLGFGLIVLHAAKLAKEGKTKEEILNEISSVRNRLESIFTVDDLEYLFRGGRVSKTAAVVGGLLNIKPILEVSEEGKLVPVEKIRGRNKVFKRMIEMMSKRGKDADLENQIVAISHGDDIESANKLKEMVEQTFGTKTFIMNMIGAAVGSHSGPGTITLFFLSK
jgi:DegV family protein with EDD domain